jgi:hypothetical protein
MTARRLSTALFIISVMALAALSLLSIGFYSTIDSLPPPPPNGAAPGPDAAGVSPEYWVRIAVTGILLLAALIVVLTKRYAPEDKNWAYGTIGAIVGYWLKA